MRWRFGLVAGVMGCAISVGATTSPKSGTSYLDLNLKQNRYLGEIQHSAQTANYTLVSADLNLEAHSDSGLSAKFNPVFQGALESSHEVYFGVPELYLEARDLGFGFNLTVGRQLRQWSRLDEAFNLGVWQPQLRWDYLAPRQQGLIGNFLDFTIGSSTQVTLYSSPLHLPDQGPNFRLRNGRFESANRWFRQPQGQVRLFEDTPFMSDEPLYFRLNRPAEEDIIMHSSFGMMIRHQAPNSPYWVRANYAYKPRNQIQLGVECTNCGNIGVAQNMEITALVHTKIVKHHVGTLEMGFDRPDDQGFVSFTADMPQSSGFPDHFEEAPLRSLLIAGAGYRHFARRVFGRPSWLSYQYLHSWEVARRRTGGLVGEDQVNSSFDRYPYERVAAVEGTLELYRKGRNRVSMSHRYSYSIPEKGGWLSSSLAWENGPMSVSLGADVIGAEVDSSSQDAGLFSRYRANDRVYGGLNYVF